MTGWTSAQAVYSLVGHGGRAQEYWTESEEVGSVSGLCFLLGTWPLILILSWEQKSAALPSLRKLARFFLFCFLFLFSGGGRGGE